jgi:hypothetical protein
MTLARPIASRTEPASLHGPHCFDADGVPVCGWPELHQPSRAEHIRALDEAHQRALAIIEAREAVR